jgi:hypothetical protein
VAVACSEGGLSSGSGGAPLIGSNEKKEDAGKSQEPVDDESAAADSPTQVSGAFLVCGKDTADRDPALPAGGVQQGCAVIDSVTLVRRTCEGHERVKVTYADGTEGDVTARSAPATSFWHFRFVTPEGKGLAGVSAHSTCGGVAEDLAARSLNYAPPKELGGDEAAIDISGGEPARKPDAGGSPPVAEEVVAPQETDEQQPKPNTDTAAPDHVIFVTSLTFSGNMLMRWGAAKLCREAAEKVKLPGKFWPLLSITFGDANGYFERNPRPVKNVKGDPIADANMLWSGSLLAPVNYDESGNRVSGHVWTGSDARGDFEADSFFTDSSGTCNSWTTTDKNDGGGVGDPNAAGGEWFDSGEGFACDQKAHIYCISE